MISKKTAGKIWRCYREIDSANKLTQDLEIAEKQNPFDEHAQKLADAFGRNQDLQLGTPCGENGHRLFNVSPELAKIMIRAHIAHKENELKKLNEAAKIELENPIVEIPEPK